MLPTLPTALPHRGMSALSAALLLLLRSARVGSRTLGWHARPFHPYLAQTDRREPRILHQTICVRRKRCARSLIVDGHQHVGAVLARRNINPHRAQTGGCNPEAALTGISGDSGDLSGDILDPPAADAQIDDLLTERARKSNAPRGCRASGGRRARQRRYGGWGWGRGIRAP